MKIHIIANDGSPLGVTMKTMFGDDPAQIGVGGAELALLTMCEAWHNDGYEIVLYNNPREIGASPFEQRDLSQFNPHEDRDILIVFRSPNLRMIGARGLKVWWSCDQYTIGNFRAFGELVDKTVVISPFHRDYFLINYGIKNAIVIDLPVRVKDYEKPEVKISDRFIFTSVPHRGLEILLRWWPTIKSQIPEASLVVTSDYRLWGGDFGRHNEQFLSMTTGLEDVIYLGAISRKELISEQLRAEIQLYPCIYDELFCISIAESQVAGIYPITSGFGALQTTNMGKVINLDPQIGLTKKNYIEETVLFRNKLRDDGYNFELQKKAIERFHPNRILEEWNKKVFK
jgi:hypothetical protein